MSPVAKLFGSANLTEPLVVVDGRFAALRKRCEVRIKPRTGVSTWFEECVLGSVELFDFVLEERVTQKPLACISVWEMDGIGYKWQMPAIGIVDMVVEPGFASRPWESSCSIKCCVICRSSFLAPRKCTSIRPISSRIDMAKKFGFVQVDEAIAYSRTGRVRSSLISWLAPINDDAGKLARAR